MHDGPCKLVPSDKVNACEIAEQSKNDWGNETAPDEVRGGFSYLMPEMARDYEGKDTWKIREALRSELSS